MKKIQRKKTKQIYCTICMALGLFLTACGFYGSTTEEPSKTTGFVAADPGIYDSADSALVLSVDTTKKQITLRNLSVNRDYTLEYDGTSCFYDKYGAALSPAQMIPGELVDLTFLKSHKRLNTMQRSKDAFLYNETNHYQLNNVTYQALIGENTYSYSEDVTVLSEGKQIELMDLNEMDVLSFRGKGSEIYSITVDKGHGYVRLRNEEYFLGGFIEIGGKVVTRVEENMLLTAPEGSHQIVISNKGVNATKQIEVKRDAETELDVGDLKGKEPKYGNVIFTIIPENALLYLDGDKTDYTEPVRLEYGIHQIIVMADGYHTITQYLKVGQESAGIDISMEIDETVSGNNIPVSELPTEFHAENNAANNTANNNQAQATTSTMNYFVTINQPSEVEVYVDGNYVGITPCNFKKEPGTHVITLRKTGYTAKSYTLQIDAEEKNVNYSFLDLVKIDT